MPNKLKLEEEYKKYADDIEQKSKEEIKKIRDKIKAVKDEAEKMGESLESTINQDAETQEKS